MMAEEVNEQAKNLWNDPLIWSKLMVIMFGILSFFLVRTMNKIDTTHVWMLKHDSVSSIYIEKIDELEERIKDLENGLHPATANRYSQSMAEKDKSEMKLWVGDHFIQKK